MTRPLRIEYENAFYHVMNRGRARQEIFHGTEYYEDFLICLEEANKRFGVEVHAYCLMGNHYHLLLKTPRANLSRIMRHIDGVYTQRHNWRRKTDGSLFRGRYKAIVIDASSYLLEVSRYIHRNPIELRKSLVNSLEEYLWSSFTAYIGKRKAPKWLNLDTVYGELASTRCYSAYKRFVAQGNTQEISKIYRLTHQPAVLGTQSFRDDIRRKVSSTDREIDRRGLAPPVPLKQIINVVAVHYGVSEDELRKAKRGKGAKNVPRWIAMKLCQEVGSARLTEIANLFNIGHYSTVSQTIRRLNSYMQNEAGTSREYNKLSQDLTP